MPGESGFLMYVTGFRLVVVVLVLCCLCLSETAAKQTLRGIVVDAETGVSLVGANVTNGDVGVVTDVTGKFSLSVVSSDSIVVTFVGFQPVVIPAARNLQPLTVRMHKVAVPISEIVVTGGFSEQTLNELPASVTVFEKKELEVSGARHIHDLIPAVANLNWAGGTSRPRYFQIRGIGERSHYAGEGPPSFSVGFVIDDVDLSGLGMAGLLHDIDQVEVFKGPQSTIFGPNAMAGLINMNSSNPSFVRSHHSSSITGGNDGLLHSAHTLNVPINDEMAVRVGYSEERSDGFRHNNFYNSDDSNRRRESLGRAKFRYEGKAGAKITGTVFRANLNNGYDAWAPDNNKDLITYSNKSGKDRQVTNAISLRGHYPLIRYATEFVTITSYTQTELEHSYDGDWGNDDFWSKEPYGHDPVKQGWLYDFFDRTVRDRTTFTQELRLHRDSIDGTGDLVVGAHIKSLEEMDDASGYLFGGLATDLKSRFTITDVAVYSQYGRSMGDFFRLSVNTRIDRSHTIYKGTTNDRADEVEFDVSQWLVGGKWAIAGQLAPYHDTYVSISRGFRAGGINQHPYLDDDSRIFNPEYVLNGEFGYRFTGEKMTSALTLFHTLRDEQQVNLSGQQDPQDPNSYYYFTANAVSGRNTGLEFGQSYRLNSALRFTGSFGYLRSHIDSYRFKISQEDTLRLGDRAAAHAPKYTMRLAGEYRHRSGFVGRLDVSRMDEFFFSDSHNQKSDPYGLLNGNIEYTRSFWSASLWGRNLLNERYAVRGFFFALEPPDYEEKSYVSYGDPRQFGIKFQSSIPY